MKYLLLIFEGEQYWIEIDNAGYAVRQINIDINKSIQVSCMEDCLGEGCIKEDDLAGITKIISQSEFEIKWKEATRNKRKIWDNQKVFYPIGKKVKCKVDYLYPQGWVLEIEGIQGIQGICNTELEIEHNEWIEGEVGGYDEENMWLKVTKINRLI